MEMAAVHVALSISTDFDRIYAKLDKLKKELEGTGIELPTVQEVLALENKFCEVARALWNGGSGDGKQ